MEKRLKIADIDIGSRCRKDFGDIEGLARSIKEIGLLQSIGVTKKGNKLIFGERRIRATLRNGDDEIDCRILDLEDILAAENAENEYHKHLTLSEKLALAKSLKEEIKKTNKPGGQKGNKNASKNDYYPGDSNRFQDNKPNRNQRTTNAQAATKAGFPSVHEMLRVDTVVEKGVPELVEAMDRDEIPPTTAARIAEMPEEEQKTLVESFKVNGHGRVKVPKAREFGVFKRWQSLMSECTGFQAWALKKFGSVEGGEVNYDAMLKDKEWDKAGTFSVVQVLDAHIEDMKRLKDSMMRSLPDRDRERLRKKGY